MQGRKKERRRIEFVSCVMRRADRRAARDERRVARLERAEGARGGARGDHVPDVCLAARRRQRSVRASVHAEEAAEAARRRPVIDANFSELGSVGRFRGFEHTQNEIIQNRGQAQQMTSS